MRRSVKKFKDKSGASFVVALIFFLICAVVTALVLAAASVNLGRLVAERKTKRAYLAVSSAARLLRDDLLDAAYTETSYTITPVNPAAGGGFACGQDADAHGAYADQVTATGNAGDLLKALFAALPDTPRVLTISADGLPDVTATVVVDSSGTIRVSLDTADPEAEACPMTLTLVAADAETYITVMRVSHVYDTGTLDAQGHIVYGLCTYEVTRTDISTTWNSGTIARGED